MAPGIFNLKQQLAFYGAYHSNPINVLIHIVFVPVLLWTGLVLGSKIPVPSFFPQVHYVFNDYLAFDLNWAAVWAAVNLAYYYVLEPAAAFLYTPQMALTVLTAASFAHRSNAIQTAAWTHFFSWVVQFIGHGAAEGRSPALLDNLLGAVVLAPLFVHIEILFYIGFKPSLRVEVEKCIENEVAKFKTGKGKKEL